MRFLALAGAALFVQSASAQTLQATLHSNGSIVNPTAVVQDPTNPRVQLAVQQNGVVKVLIDGVVQPTPFLTVPVNMFSGASGLLGLTFDPDYASNGHFYVNYSATGPYMRVSRYKRSTLNPLVADPLSELHIFQSPRPVYLDHNSGTLNFGMDGMLYLPTGDGGGEGDPDARAQNPNDLLGKFLRIDPRSDDYPLDPDANYHVPADNPFVDGNPIPARPEIWAFGYRNPWKWSFDDWTKLGTGAMVIADVGQADREEVDYEPAGQGGRNYGWSRYEGTFVIHPERNLAYEPHTLPILEVEHPTSISITGGQVYRGLMLGEEAFGRYFFADWVFGSVWSLGLSVDPQTGEATATDLVDHTAEFGISLGQIVSIDVDSQGELYLSDYGNGDVWKLSRRNSTWLKDVDRADGLIVGGQVRSLVAQDSKLLTLKPFTPNFSQTKKTTTIVGFETNVFNGAGITFTVIAKVSQSLSVPCVLKVKNWSTSAYDTVAQFNLNGNMSSHQGNTGLLNHMRLSDKRIEARIETSFTGPLLGPQLATVFDKVSAVVN